MRTFLRLPLALLIALGAITGVHAQSKDTRTVIPVWNKGSTVSSTDDGEI